MHNKFKIPIPSGAPRKALALLLSVAMLIPMASAIIVALDVAVAPAPALAAAPETTLADGSPLPYYVVKYPNPEAVPQDVRDRWAAQGGGINDEGYLVVPGCNNPGWSDTRPALNATAPNAAAIATNLAKNLCVSRTESVMPCQFCVDCQKKLYEDMYTTFSTFTYAGLLGLGAVNVPNTLRDSINTSVNSGNFDGPMFTPFIYDYVAPAMIDDLARPMIEELVEGALAGANMPEFIDAEGFIKATVDEIMANLFDESFIKTVFKGPQSWPYTDPSLLQDAPFGGILTSIKDDTAFINYLKQESIVAMTKTQADIIWNNGNPTRGEGSVATVNMQGSNVNIVRGHWNNTTGMLTGSGATLSVLADRVQPRRWSRVGMVYDPLLQLTETGPIIQDPGNIYTFEQRIETMNKVMKVSDLDLDDVFAHLDMNKLIINIQDDYDNIIVPEVTGVINGYKYNPMNAGGAGVKVAFAEYFNDLMDEEILNPSMSMEEMMIEAAKHQDKVISYTINYYLDGVLDGKVTIPETVDLYTKLVNLDPINPDKYTGYWFERTEPAVWPETIGNRGVLNVYYVTPIELSYKVEYYIDGDFEEDETITKLGWPNDTQLVVDSLDVYKYPGYILRSTDPSPLPNQIDGGSVIKAYYGTDDDQRKIMSYTVENYINGVFVDSTTVSEDVQFNATHMDVVPVNAHRFTGYKLSITFPPVLPATIVGGGVIKAYYVRDESVPPAFPKFVEPHPSPDKIRTIVKNQWVNGYLITDDGYLIVYGCPGPGEGNLCAPKGGANPNEYCVDCQIKLKDVVPYPGTYTGPYTLLNGYLVVEDCPGPGPLVTTGSGLFATTSRDTSNNRCAPKTGSAKPYQYCVDCQISLFEELRNTVKNSFIFGIIQSQIGPQFTSGNFDEMLTDSIKGMFDAETLMPMLSPMISDLVEQTLISMGVPEGMDIAYMVDLIMASDAMANLVNSLFESDYGQALIDRVVDDAFEMVMSDQDIIDAIIDMATEAVVSTVAARFWNDGNPSTSHWNQTNRNWTSLGITTTMMLEGIGNLITGDLAAYLDPKYMNMGGVLDVVGMDALMAVVLNAVVDVTADFWDNVWEPAIVDIAQGYVDDLALDWFEGWSITATKEDLRYVSYDLVLNNSGDWYNAIISAGIGAGFIVNKQTDENGDNVNYFDTVTATTGLIPTTTNKLVEKGRAPNGTYTVEVSYSGVFDLSSLSGGLIKTPVYLHLAKETVTIVIEGRDPNGEGIFDRAIAQMLAGPSTEYHPIIVEEFVEVAAIIAYDWVALQAELARGGFTDFEYYDYDADMQADMNENRTPHAFAKKEVDGKTVVAVIIRGTGTEYDGINSLGRWVSNLNMNTTTGFHDGFYGATMRVYANLNNYLTKRGLSLKDGDTKLFISGHSRGGAVGNLLAGYIQSNDYGSKENIYDYNFAATDIAIVDIITKSAWEDPNGAYNNIFNINNEWDLFAYFPGILTNLLGDNSKWAKYGRTLWFNDGSNNSTLLGAHRPELYIKYLTEATPVIGKRLETYNSGTVSQTDVLTAALGTGAVYNEFNSPIYTGNQEALIRLIFDPGTYAEENPAVAKEVGLSTDALLKHFLDNSHDNPELLNVFSNVYNSDYYIANNGAIAAVFKDDPVMMFKYFLTVGINAGDHSIEGWTVEDYKAANPALVSLYGNDLKMYYIHFNLYGI